MPGLLLIAQLDGPPQQGWWWSTLASGPALTLLAVALLCLLLLVYLGVRLRRVTAAQRRSTVRERLAGDSGVAMIEFVLVTPILLFITLLLLQTALVFTGLFYVQYSAFAAARSAIVYIPSDYGLPPNEIDLRSDKSSVIIGSAMIAVAPVSGRESGTSRTEVDVGPMFSRGFSSMYSSLGEDEPPWVNGMLNERLYYAINHTEVELHRVYPGVGDGAVRFEPLDGYTTFGPKDAVAVTVHHEFALTVPLASRAFALAGESGSYTPASRSGSESPGPPGQWTLIKARAILTNEGIDRRLPPAPAVPRR